ncbi:glycosyltransferase family 39 protein [Thalassoglobus sp. JC818]|uniref:ArnT family glycosyltransferase n=1 Tax=Thalassoglobus sp. JC818 TaxID=3232136 RepID=UPI0034574E07
MVDDQIERPTRISLGQSNWLFGGAVFVIMWATLIAYYQFKFDLNIPPSTSGDEVDYDSLGWELAHGRGFRVDLNDPEFREPYDVAAQTSERFRLPHRESEISTTRPPFYPWAISYINRLVGRQFWGTRILDAAFVAATGALLAVCVRQDFGMTAAGLSIILFLGVDVRTRLYGRAILTEAMAMFFVSLICVVILKLRFHKFRSRIDDILFSVAIGLLIGFAVLVRTLMILWLPGICLLLLLIWMRLGFSAKRSALLVACAMSGVLLAIVPWCVRNIAVTGEFMPMGTQGLVQLSASFGDEVWESGGVWRNLEHSGFFDEVVSDDQTPVEREVAKAKWSRTQAKEWIFHQPGRAIALIPMKIKEEFRPRNLTEAVILCLFLLGIWPALWTSSGRVCLALLAINAIAIGATWSVEGRFLVPVLLPMHYVAVLGIVWIALMIPFAPLQRVFAQRQVREA